MRGLFAPLAQAGRLLPPVDLHAPRTCARGPTEGWLALRRETVDKFRPVAAWYLARKSFAHIASVGEETGSPWRDYPARLRGEDVPLRRKVALSLSLSVSGSRPTTRSVKSAFPFRCNRMQAREHARDYVRSAFEDGPIVWGRSTEREKNVSGTIRHRSSGQSRVFRWTEYSLIVSAVGHFRVRALPLIGNRRCRTFFLERRGTCLAISEALAAKLWSSGMASNIAIAVMPLQRTITELTHRPDILRETT